MAKYRTLLIRTHAAEPWAIHFGDYDADVVRDERADVLDAEPETLCKIITTDEAQSAIDASVAALNRHFS